MRNIFYKFFSFRRNFRGDASSTTPLSNGSPCKMLKHATPRISPCLTSTDPPPHHLKNFTETSYPALKRGQQSAISNNNSQSYANSVNHSTPLKTNRPTYREREVDCEGLIHSPLCAIQKGPTSERLSFGSFLGGKILSLGSVSSSESGRGPVITYGRAIVRRGLSFSSKKTSDSLSVRSVKSDIQESKSAELREQKPLSKTESLMVLSTANVNTTRELRTAENQRTEKTEQTLAFRNCKESSLQSDFTAAKKTESSVCPNDKKMYVFSQTDHSSIKSLLRLPGVYNHIPVPQSTPYDTPHLLSPDSLSLNYPDSFITSNSGRTSSRSWSSNASSNTNNTNNSSTSNCSSTSEPTSVSR